MKRAGQMALVLTAVVLSLSATLRSADAPAKDSPAPAETQAKPAKVAVIKLTNQLAERPAGFSFSLLGGMGAKQPALSQLIVQLDKAARDPALAGVLLDLKSFNLTLNQAQEVGRLLSQVRAAKKRVAVYAPEFDTPTYVLASHADTILMPEHGEMMMPGVQIGLMFFKDLLEKKLSLKADFVQVGKYKGAEEPFTRTEASPEFKAQIEALVDAMFNQVVATVAKNRQLEEKDVAAAIDEAWLTGKRAKTLGLVDHLMNREKVDAWLESQFKDGAELVTDYGEPKKKKMDMENPFAIFALLGEAKPKTRTTAPAVAVVYADGEITGDTSEESLSGDEGVTPSRMRKALEKALKDDLVKAIVLRVDSPGGSATASDDIWQLLKDADKKKPVTVSMGRLAASGGYYIATAGRSITADEATITGSIGVVGGKIVTKGLTDWAGINIQTVSRGKHAGMLSSQQPFTDEERTFIRNLMTETYDLFTSRVKAGRGDKIPSIDDVAQGRLFDGHAALKAGLVDKVGTLQETIAAAAKKAGIDKNYQILTYPEAKTLADILRDGFAIDAKLPLELSTALHALPPEYQREALKLLRLTGQLHRDHVLLALPVGLVEK